ncbi:hypothetical protein QZH41_012284 [Actinostola sp. cb2023]|nr:hypothetical protein QZH41_012284 [Actinostola sp. cb2023]
MAGHRYSERSPQESVSLFEKQDAKLDRFLEEMKPYVLRLPHKLERQRVGLWIKKLCEPPGPTPSARNLAEIHQTGLGTLAVQELEALCQKLQEYLDLESAENYRQQVVLILYHQPGPQLTVVQVEAPSDQVQNVSKPYQTNGYSQYSRGVNFTTNTTFRDDLNLSKSNEREVELKVKMVEAKFHEEKLKLQQQHDVAVQKILDRKNMELEEIKSHYRNKITELEGLIKKQERKLSQVSRDTTAIKEQKDKQITELKSLANQTGESAFHDYEKKLSDKIADFESEKIEMQKQHTNNIQELLDETNQRLQKMEEEYSQQTASTGVVMQDLEARVHQLTEESEALQNSRSKLAKEKEELADKVLMLTNELKDARTTMTKYERGKARMMKDHQQTIQQLQRKTDSTIGLMKQEHSASTSRSGDAISDLESQISQLKQALQETEFQRQKQVRELESSGQQDKMNMEHLYDKKFRSIQTEIDQQETEYQKHIRKMEGQLKERDEQIQRQTEMQKQQAHQAERALDDFKEQVEKNSGKMFDEMKIQMEKVEEDLAHSKKIRERQSKEFSRQLDDMKMKHDKMIAELSISHEQEKAQLLRVYQAERECLLREQEQERDLQSDRLHQKMMDMEIQYKERSSKDSKAIGELEHQVRDLREEVMQTNSLRKTQLMELNMIREEEKQTYKRQEENLQARSKSEVDQQKLELRRAHSNEMEQLLEKTNERLRIMEQEYTSRSGKSQEAIRTQENEMKKLREDNLRQRLNSDKKLSDLTNRSSDEKTSLKKQRDSIVSSLEQELQAQKTMVRHSEKRCQQLDLESQEKISRLRLQYEEKMKGLMPESVREELEDTIESLRQQVSVLQSRAQVLQEELDTRNKLSMSSLNTSSYRDDSYR